MNDLINLYSCFNLTIKKKLLQISKPKKRKGGLGSTSAAVSDDNKMKSARNISLTIPRNAPSGDATSESDKDTSPSILIEEV